MTDAGAVPSVDKAATGVQPLPFRSLEDVARRQPRGHSKCYVCREPFESGDRRCKVTDVYLCEGCAVGFPNLDPAWWGVV